MQNKPGLVLKQVECYSTNVGEMASEIYKALIDPKTEELKDIKLKEAVAVIQAAYDQTRETIFECAGKDITPQLGDSIQAQILAVALSTIGLRIDNPIVPDSIVL